MFTKNVLFIGGSSLLYCPRVTHPSHCIHVISLTGYQVYKKRCHHGSDDSDSEAPSLEGDQVKVKDGAVDSSAFEFNEHGSSKKKSQDDINNTKMWDQRVSWAERETMNFGFGHSQGRKSREKCSCLARICILKVHVAHVTKLWNKHIGRHPMTWHYNDS